jgi:hypothetical protein
MAPKRLEALKTSTAKAEADYKDARKQVYCSVWPLYCRTAAAVEWHVAFGGHIHMRSSANLQAGLMHSQPLG